MSTTPQLTGVFNSIGNGLYLGEPTGSTVSSQPSHVDAADANLSFVCPQKTGIYKVTGYYGNRLNGITMYCNDAADGTPGMSYKIGEPDYFTQTNVTPNIDLDTGDNLNGSIAYLDIYTGDRVDRIGFLTDAGYQTAGPNGAWGSPKYNTRFSCMPGLKIVGAKAYKGTYLDYIAPICGPVTTTTAATTTPTTTTPVATTSITTTPATPVSVTSTGDTSTTSTPSATSTTTSNNNMMIMIAIVIAAAVLVYVFGGDDDQTPPPFFPPPNYGQPPAFYPPPFAPAV